MPYPTLVPVLIQYGEIDASGRVIVTSVLVQSISHLVAVLSIVVFAVIAFLTFSYFTLLVSDPCWIPAQPGFPPYPTVKTWPGVPAAIGARNPVALSLLYKSHFAADGTLNFTVPVTLKRAVGVVSPMDTFLDESIIIET